MRRFTTAILALTLLASKQAWVDPETYLLDPLQTNVSWYVSHYGFSIVSGKFTRVNGKLILDDESPETSKISAVITLEHVYTGIDNLDAKLKTKDIFNIRNFPEATFNSTKVTIVDKDKRKYKAEGILSLNGFNKPVVLDVTLNKVGIQPLTTIKTAGFSASTTIQRTEFGMTYGLPDIGNDVQINIQVEAALQDTGINADQ